MKIKETEAAIEAILFAMGGSVELPRIARAIGVDEKTTGRIIRNMMDRYQEENRGIQIIELENSFQMCTKKEYYQYLINIALHPQKPALSDVMLETLSIIAYKQPVTKAEIEKIRGVKCDHAIKYESSDPQTWRSVQDRFTWAGYPVLLYGFKESCHSVRD